MKSVELTAGAATPAPTAETAPPEPSVDGEVLDLTYGTGAFLWLDSDDIDALIASGEVWMPPTTAPVPGKDAQPSKPTSRRAA